MKDVDPGETWLDRLRRAVEADTRSKRKLSIDSGMAHGYIHSLLSEGKDPTISNLINVCRELNISLSWLLFGIEMSAETEEILTRLEKNPDSRAGILQILRNARKP